MRRNVSSAYIAMVEEGIAEVDDLLKGRIAALKLDRDKAQTALDRLKASSASANTIDAESVERFGRVMRENVTSGDVPFRKAYLRSLIDRVEVDDHVIRIIGDKSTLEQAIAGREIASAGVRRCEPKWRTRHAWGLRWHLRPRPRMGRVGG